MSNIGFDSLNAIDLFDNDMDDNNIILHIPHSSTNIPNTFGYVLNSKAIHDELSLITDWSTDTIFLNDNISRVVCNFSRIYCDVERLQVNEPMDEFGRGIYYTKTIDGKPLREVHDNIKHDVQKLYDKHYQRFNIAINDKLKSNDDVIIIDCHSFNNEPLAFEDKSKKRPDICIGINEFHTPIELQKKVVDYFKRMGLTVEINYPYSNTIVPFKYLNKDKRVQSIMIEVNKRLYMYEGEVIDGNVQVLNNFMTRLYDVL